MGNAVATSAGAAGGGDGCGCSGSGMVDTFARGGRVVVQIRTLDGRHTLQAELDDERANRLELGINQARRQILDEQTRARQIRPPQGPSDGPANVPP